MIPLFVLVFVQPQDIATPLAASLTRSMEHILGHDAAVSVRALPEAATPRALLEVGRTAGATAIARVTWSDERQMQALVTVTTVGNEHTATQSVSFADADTAVEKGRALGLIVASILDPQAAAAGPRPPPPSTAPSSDERRSGDRGGPAADAVALTPPPAAGAPPPGRFVLDATVGQAIPLHGDGAGTGGALGMRWLASRRVGLRLGLAGRFGELGAAQATTRSFLASAGVVLPVLGWVVADPAEGTATTRLGLAVRAELLAIDESLSHLSSDDPTPVSRSKWSPGAALRVEGHFALSNTVGILAAGGMEAAFGGTDVIVHQVKVGELAPWRGTLEVGLTARF